MTYEHMACIIYFWIHNYTVKARPASYSKIYVPQNLLMWVVYDILFAFYYFELQVSEELLWELFVQAGPVGKFLTLVYYVLRFTI